VICFANSTCKIDKVIANNDRWIKNIDRHWHQEAQNTIAAPAIDDLATSR
jgi:hypothetical protein